MQLVLLVVVGRRGSLDDVGLLALASAVAFNCGSIAEAGFNTSLSVPEAYLGERHPPLAATRRARFAAALGGSLLYALLWAAGLGRHEPVLLIPLALPALLAISYGYAGVMNAAGQLRIEGRISVAESVLAMALLFPLLSIMAPLAAALTALVAGRAVGTLARAASVRHLPQSDVAAVSGLGRTHAWFVATQGSTALHAQIDVIILGFFGSFALLGVYGPLVRIAYAGLLVAEGLAWGLYGRTTHERVVAAGRRPQRSLGDRLLGNWRLSGMLIGCACAAGFWLLGAPLLEFVIDRSVDGLRLPVTLLALAVLVRFGMFVLCVDIIRGGLQKARLPVELLAAAVLGGMAVVGALDDSLTALSIGKVMCEVVILAGYWRIARVLVRDPLGRTAAHA